MTTLSRLLTGLSTVSHDDDGIPAFHIAEGNDLYISTPTFTSERSTIGSEDQLEDFLEPEYEE